MKDADPNLPELEVEDGKKRLEGLKSNLGDWKPGVDPSSLVQTRCYA